MNTSVMEASFNQGIPTLSGIMSIGEVEDYAEELAAYEEVTRLAEGRQKARYQSDFRKSPSVSRFVEDNICYRLGKPVSFQMRPWLPAIYDSAFTTKTPPKDLVKGPDGKLSLSSARGMDLLEGARLPRRKILCLTARQNEKSTFLGNLNIALSTLIKNVTALYVSSASQNMNEFAEERIEMPIRISPRLKSKIGRFISFNRYMKRLERNNSKIVMRSAHRSADRSRGVAADIVSLDEVQNFVAAHIPVILATTNNSEIEGGPIHLLAGTPLTTDNQIQRIWSRESTQNRWVMPCPRCRTENYALLESCGPRGLICKKCGKGLSPHNGFWVTHGDPNATWEGFHLSRALMPYTRIKSLQDFENAWGTFYADINSKTVPENVILNENFGISADNGKRPLSREQLVRCCHPGLRNSLVVDRRVIQSGNHAVCMGIDWAEGSGHGSYCVVTMGYFNGDKFEVSCIYRYMGAETASDFIVEHIVGLIERNNVAVVFADAGGGWGMIPQIRHAIENGLQRVIPVRYVGRQSAPIAYDIQGHAFVVQRTRWMAEVFRRIRIQRVTFPRIEEFGGELRPEGGFDTDFLTIFSEVSADQQLRYNHTDPDDAFHAVGYALMGAMWIHQMLGTWANM